MGMGQSWWPGVLLWQLCHPAAFLGRSEGLGAAAVPPSLHPGPLPAVPGAGDAAGPALPPSPGPSHPSYTV